MLSKCANPACLARLHYLHEGRIFSVDMGRDPSQEDNAPIHKVERFWLCDVCVQSLKIVRENGTVTVRPLRLQLTDGAAHQRALSRREVA